MASKMPRYQPPNWSDEEKALLRVMWPAGHKVGVIQAAIAKLPSAIVRSEGSIRTKTRDLALDYRNSRAENAGPRIGNATNADAVAIEAPGPSFQIETSKAAEHWAGVQFEDHPRACKAEMPLRGRPPLMISTMGCTAQMLADTI